MVSYHISSKHRLLTLDYKSTPLQDLTHLLCALIPAPLVGHLTSFLFCKQPPALLWDLGTKQTFKTQWKDSKIKPRSLEGGVHIQGDGK